MKARLAVLGLALVAVAVACGEDAAPAIAPATSVAPAGGAIHGVATRSGYPVAARVEVRPVRSRPLGRLVFENRFDWAFPVPDAFLAEPAVARGAPLAAATADAEGRFSFPGLAPGRYEVRADLGDAVVGERVEIALPGARVGVRFDLAGAFRTVRGVARWRDGRPFAGVVLAGAVATETAEDGSFTLAGVPADEPAISVFAKGRLARDFELNADDGEVDLVVDEGAAPLEGTVVAADTGEPVVGARVYAEGSVLLDSVNRFPRREFVTAAATDAAGRFRSEAGDGCRITVRADGFAAWSGRREDLTEPLRLERAPVVSGRVVAADGTPCAGVPVVLVPGWYGERTEGRTDAGGRFRLVGSQLGEARCVAFGNGFAMDGLAAADKEGYDPAALHLEAGEAVELEILAVPAGSFAGRLTEPDGTGVAGTVITAEGKSELLGEWLSGRRRAVTAADGSYRIDSVLPGALLEVYPTCEERPVTWDVHATADPGEEVACDLVWATPPLRRFVEVRAVVAGTEEPVGGVRPCAWTRQEEDRSSDWDVWSKTGGDGRARVGPLPDGPLVVSASHPESLRIDRMTLEADLVTVELDPGLSITGRLLGPDGAPAADMVVEVRETESGGSGPRGVTDADGRFRIDGLPPGPTSLGALPVGALHFCASPQLYAGEWTVEAGSEDVELVLDRSVPAAPEPAEPPPAGRIEGVVRGPDGSAVRGAYVSAWPVGRTDRSSEDTDWPEGSAHSDLDGRFRIERLPEGAYDLRVIGPPGLRAASPVPTETGRTDVEVALTPAVSVRVTVLDPAGQPVAGAEASVWPLGVEPSPWDDAERLVAATTDAKGGAGLSGLAPDTSFVLFVTPPWDREDLAEHVIREWTPADATVRLVGLRTLSGVVRDRDGFPVEGAEIRYRSEADAEDWNVASVDPDGRYEIEEVPCLPLLLRVGPPGAEPEDASMKVFSVDADATTFDLEVDGGGILRIRIEGWPDAVEGEVPRAGSWYRGGTTRYVTPALGPGGEVRIHGVPPGARGEIWAALPDGRMAYATGLEPDAPARVVPLVPGKRIAGRIVAEGETTDFRLTLMGGPSLSLTVPVGPDGRFEIRGLPDGKWSLWASARVVGERYSGSADVRAGAEDVEITLAPR